MKKHIHLIGISIVFFLLIILLLAFSNNNSNNNNNNNTNLQEQNTYSASTNSNSYNIDDIRTKYIITPDVCKGIWGCTPEEFFDEELSYYTQIEDLRKKAELDNGNLVLRLTEIQKISLVYIYLGAIEEILGADWFTINEDYSGFTISAYSDNINSCIWQLPFTIFQGMMLKQVIDGKPMDDISVKVIVKDAGTDKIVYTATFPQEEVVLGFDKSLFSDR